MRCLVEEGRKAGQGMRIGDTEREGGMATIEPCKLSLPVFCDRCSSRECVCVCGLLLHDGEIPEIGYLGLGKFILTHTDFFGFVASNVG